MSCRELEPLIALYAGRDLERGESARVEEHVESCVACRELLEELRADRAAVEEWGSEPIDPALLASVRSGVMARLGRRRVVLWPWVAAAAIAFAFLAASPRMRVEPIRPVMRAPVAAALDTAAVEKPPVPPRRRRAPRRVAEYGEPLVVKMYTDDPDIVIVWLVDQTGD